MLIRNESGQSRTNDKNEHIKTSDLLRHNKPDIDIGGCRNNGDRRSAPPGLVAR